MTARIYVENFEDGPGGWLGWDARGPRRLEFVEGAVLSQGPWWVDSNHAPPGGGYLHLLYCLHTHRRCRNHGKGECAAPVGYTIEEQAGTRLTGRSDRA